MGNNTMASESLNLAQDNQVLTALFTIFKPIIKEAVRDVLEEQTESIRQAEDDKKLINTEQACKMIGVDRGTLWRWNKEQYLCVHKVGKKNLYRVGDIRRLMEKEA